MASFLDDCWFNATSTGTGDFVVASAVTGYQTPASANAVNAAVYRYRAQSVDLSQWEVGFGAYTSGSVTLARTTVLFNSSGTTAKISFSTIPQVAVVLLAEDLGPLLFTNATLQASPASPTGTTSLSAVMMGLGGTCKITPVYSTRVDLRFQGVITNTVASNGTAIQARFGTGVAPANAAAATGTTIGSSLTGAPGGTNWQVPFNVGGIITGLTPGTAYWFDLSLFVGGGTGTVASISCSAMEF